MTRSTRRILVALSFVALAAVATAGCTDDPSPATPFGNPAYPVTPAPVSVGTASPATT